MIIISSLDVKKHTLTVGGALGKVTLGKSGSKINLNTKFSLDGAGTMSRTELNSAILNQMKQDFKVLRILIFRNFTKNSIELNLIDPTQVLIFIGKII
ncbi:hypothetical protein LCGC14_1161550 [marine sediment metagenome]|uniref:Uncharacterized protein n=1 Tax=marine sediment metagenome TaxID=412755 RepID=A0A0F9PAS6_9ZZZZ